MPWQDKVIRKETLESSEKKQSEAIKWTTNGELLGWARRGQAGPGRARRGQAGLGGARRGWGGAGLGWGPGRTGLGGAELGGAGLGCGDWAGLGWAGLQLPSRWEWDGTRHASRFDGCLSDTTNSSSWYPSCHLETRAMCFLWLLLWSPGLLSGTLRGN